VKSITQVEVTRDDKAQYL